MVVKVFWTRIAVSDTKQYVRPGDGVRQKVASMRPDVRQLPGGYLKTLTVVNIQGGAANDCNPPSTVLGW